MDYGLWALAVALVVTGIAGTVLPALPGVALVLAGLLTAAAIDNFQRVSWISVCLLVILTVAAFAIDYLAAVLGAKRAGASRAALVGAALGTLLGFALGIFGFLFGPFLGAATGELIARQDLVRAGQVGLQTWIGILLGSIAKVALAFTMIGIFVVAYFW